MPLLLASPAIPPGGEIPSQYTCDGAGISPPLTWCGLPDGTESLVLVVEYPNAGGFHEARNDLRKAGYGGPCPPRARESPLPTSASLQSASRPST